jgi:arylsulfatase A-like enzyme
MRVNRRRFLVRSASALAAASLGPLAGCGRGAPSRDPELPNFLLITADNLGWHDLGCYGNRSIATPGLDRLAREGVQFENAFVASSSCAPSRAAIVTGQYPHTNGVTALTHLEPTKQLSPFRRTLPELLERAGYHTAIEGKWHVAPYLPASWYGYRERLSGLLPEAQRIRDSRTTIDFLRRHREHRFFLQVNYTNSHRDPFGEYHGDPDFPVDPAEIEIPAYMALPDWPEIREDLARYFSQNLRMEQMIGEVLTALDELGLAERTLVVFLSDNGPHYPGMISTLYDRGIATPLLLRWPVRLPAGRVVDELVSSLDLLPTFLAAAGVPVPQDAQGRSLLALVAGDAPPEWREAVFAEQTRHVLYIPCRAARTHRHKYIRNWSDVAFGLDQNAHDDWAHRLCERPGNPWKRPRPPEELYDLRSDPVEQRNLAAEPEHAESLERMRGLLGEHMTATRDPYLDRPFEHLFDPEAYARREPGYRYW